MLTGKELELFRIIEQKKTTEEAQEEVQEEAQEEVQEEAKEEAVHLILMTCLAHQQESW